MLPARARLTHRDDFSATIRHGRRGGRTMVLVYLLLAPDRLAHDDAASAQVGLVVSKAVGGAVVRHAVARRLRHVMRDRLAALPPGSRVVLRALPAAGAASSAELGREIDRALRRLLVSTARFEPGSS